MYCIHCGKEIPDAAQFCHHCGGLQEQNRVAASQKPEIKDENQQSASRKRKIPAFVNKKTVTIAIVAVMVLCVALGIIARIPKTISSNVFSDVLNQCGVAEVTFYKGSKYLFEASTYQSTATEEVAQIIISSIENQKLTILKGEKLQEFNQSVDNQKYISLSLNTQEYNNGCYVKVGSDGSLYVRAGDNWGAAETGYETLYAQLEAYFPQYGDAVKLADYIPEIEWTSLMCTNKKSDGTFDSVHIRRETSVQNLAKELRERTVYIGGEKNYILHKNYAEMSISGVDGYFKMAGNGSGNGYIYMGDWKVTVNGTGFLVKLLTKAIS